MTVEEQIKLCTIYNNSDIDALEYMKPFCNTEQKRLLQRLINLNLQTKIGWGNSNYTMDEYDEYYNGKWKLLNDFGLENIGGDAYFEGKFYE